jgi:hypothetical protein
MLKSPVSEGKVYVRRDGKITGPMQFDFPLKHGQAFPQDLQFFDPVHKWYYDSWGSTGIDQNSVGHPADLVGEFSNASGSPANVLDEAIRADRAKLGDSPGAGTVSCIDEKSGRVEEIAIKHDAGKVPYDVLPLDLLDSAARVFGHGAKKYTRGNFRKGGGFDPYRPLGAALRHLAEVQRALDTGSHDVLVDKDFGESHLAHAICSLLILTDSMRQRGWNV